MFLLPRRRRSMLRLNAIFIIKYLSDNHCFIQKKLDKISVFSWHDNLPIYSRHIDLHIKQENRHQL